MLLNKKQYMSTECLLLRGRQWEGRFGGVLKPHLLQDFFIWKRYVQICIWCRRDRLVFSSGIFCNNMVFSQLSDYHHIPPTASTCVAFVRQPLQSATPPHWETSPKAARAIPGPTRRRIVRRLPNRIQTVFGRAAVFYSTIGMGWQKMHKAVEAWKQKKIHINNMHTLHIYI